jgi:hypothetical protein
VDVANIIDIIVEIGRQNMVEYGGDVMPKALTHLAKQTWETAGWKRLISSLAYT